ncbi:hypothetical protein [Burkholderia sp. BCC1988]|uniref:hypothetical protein n=1 Tax=Burkholderia sp. BCC1988 TaxID=2817443 RepID=UPI002AB10712|nr:hypothetical protein [Burkholderia sp. BCC1988]
MQARKTLRTGDHRITAANRTNDNARQVPLPGVAHHPMPLSVIEARLDADAHSHSIVNRSRKPAWLKGFAVIDMTLYRRFYRHTRTSFAGAGDGAICGATTLATQSSITSQGYRRQ